MAILTSFSFAGASQSLAEISNLGLLPFQGRLTDLNNKVLPDGVRLVQFQIYNDPTAGRVLWTGEIHRATVNGGLINVMLGTKNPLPTENVDRPGKSFYDQPLYLQVRVDSNGDDMFTDDTVDPPLLPRQLILPVLFSQESASSRDSQKLAGYDWSVLFGVNDPRGALPGSRIAPASIDGAHLTNGAVSIEKLAPREVGIDVREGGFAISDASEQWNSPTPSQPTQVKNLTVSIKTTGRPVVIALTSGGSSDALATPSTLSYLQGRRGISANLAVLLYRGDKEVANEFFQASGDMVLVSPGSVRFYDRPEPGKHVYSIRVSGQTLSGIEVRNVALVAYEL